MGFICVFCVTFADRVEESGHPDFYADPESGAQTGMGKGPGFGPGRGLGSDQKIEIPGFWDSQCRIGPDRVAGSREWPIWIRKNRKIF